jgi:hypothetical protein
MSAWKRLELRVVRAWGGQRRGLGQPGSDGVGAPVALEVKRSKRRVPEGRWIAQAIAQGRREGLPWVLVVAGYRDRRPIAVCDHGWLLELARRAGLLDGGGR